MFLDQDLALVLSVRIGELHGLSFPGSFLLGLVEVELVFCFQCCGQKLSSNFFRSEIEGIFDTVALFILGRCHVPLPSFDYCYVIWTYQGRFRPRFERLWLSSVGFKKRLLVSLFQSVFSLISEVEDAPLRPWMRELRSLGPPTYSS